MPAVSSLRSLLSLLQQEEMVTVTMVNDDLLDALTVVGFLIGLANYSENLTQSDKQDLQEQLDRKTDEAIKLIREHLTRQDEKLDEIMGVLNHDS